MFQFNSFGVYVLWYIVICHMILTLDCTEKNLIIFHPRKAGGTTVLQWIRNYSQQLSDKYSINITVKHIEIFPFTHKKQNINEILNENGLFIISMRDPISRIISQYDFEWRWGCMKCNYSLKLKHTEMVKNNKRGFQFINDDYNDTEIMQKYKFSNIEFTEFLDRVEKEKLNFYKVYLNNYYLWLFCCDDMICDQLWNNDHKNSTNIKWKLQCLNHAKTVINNMDIVLISEWLTDFRSIVFANEIINKYLDVNEQDLRKPKNLNVASKKRLVNNKMISTNNYDKLSKWNMWDIKLYQYVKQVAYDRIESIWG